MAENHTLRGLLRSLGAFIGEGVGGLLPKLGWDVSEFNNLIDRSETDTAWESYQRRKKQTESPSSTPVPSSSSTKRRSEDDVSKAAKKPRVNLDDGERAQNGFPLVMPMNQPPLSANNMYASPPTQDNNGMFPSLIRGSPGSPMFMQASGTSPVASQYSPSGPSLNNYQTSYVPNVNINIESALPGMPFSPASAGAPSVQRVPTAAQLPADQVDDEDDQNKSEAYKLITYVSIIVAGQQKFTIPGSYHLDNFKRNSSYCLPASLRPTLVQRYNILS